MADVGAGRELEHGQVLKVDIDADVVQGSGPDIVDWPDYGSERPEEVPIGRLDLTINPQPVGEKGEGRVAIPTVVGGELPLNRVGSS